MLDQCAGKSKSGFRKRINRYWLLAELTVLVSRFRGISAKQRGHMPISRANVLIVRLDAIGDLVLFSPFLREMRRSVPDCRVTLVVNPSTYNLVELCPYVDEVFACEIPTNGRVDYFRQFVAGVKLLAGRLRSRRFDVALLPRWDADYYGAAFLVALSGAPVRMAYSQSVAPWKQRVNIGHDKLFTHVLASDGTVKHEVERNLDFLRFVGGLAEDHRLEVWVGPEDEAYADCVMRRLGRSEFLVALGPGSREPKKCWPVVSFCRFGEWLAQSYGARLIVVGGPAEEGVGEALESRVGARVLNLAGSTTLRQVAAVLRRCHMFVGNDSGVLHIAAAVGLPVVQISCHPKEGSDESPYSPVRFGPWGVPSVIVQPDKATSPCRDYCDANEPHCIRAVTVDDVQNAFIRLLRMCGIAR